MFLLVVVYQLEVLLRGLGDSTLVVDHRLLGLF